MDDEAAIDGLNRLGLTAYESQVFLGLQKLASGTVSDVVDVPRSQVYGAAETLEGGLVDDGTMLLSVYSTASAADGNEEVTFWSSETTFAAVLGGFLREWFTGPRT